MLTLVLACLPKDAPVEASGEAASTSMLERSVLTDAEGGEHPTWKLHGDLDLARDLVGELAVQRCLESLESGYDTCALKDDCMTVVVSKEDGVLSTLVAMDAQDCSVGGKWLVLDTDGGREPKVVLP